LSAPRWSAAEIKLLRRLISEGHSPLSAAITIGRSPLAVKQKASQLGLHCVQGRYSDNDSVKFFIRVEKPVFETLAAVAKEIEVSPYRLARILLTCIAQQNMWSTILRLSDNGDYLIKDDGEQTPFT
jgi:hypothetical protein